MVPESRLTHLVVLSWQALQDSLFTVVMLANKRSRCQNVYLQHFTCLMSVMSSYGNAC